MRGLQNSKGCSCASCAAPRSPAWELFPLQTVLCLIACWYLFEEILACLPENVSLQGFSFSHVFAYIVVKAAKLPLFFGLVVI